jgi:non-canonical purine NTP pyrophosphatase (RdgB/HAM1 family)
MKLLIATRNQGKLREYEYLLADLKLDLLDLRKAGIATEVEETGATFEENALLKAETYAQESGLLTLADDSGLEVSALGGEPSIRSARYDGGCGSDEDRYRLLLRRLEGLPEQERGACFRCVIAIATPAGEVHTAGGACEGWIALEPQGHHGFGYDPVFFVPEFGCTLAQLPPEVKNTISHRSRAAEGAQEILRRLQADQVMADGESGDLESASNTIGIPMTHGATEEALMLGDLRDGLIMRRATLADIEALAAFNAEVHRDWETGEPDEGVAALTRDLMSGHHPTSSAGDFIAVEDTHTGVIVSSLCLISQTWSYGGIEFDVGRPELVGTHPDYRHRGLVRAQFEVIHDWSARRGQKVQAIAGVPCFYRQFGYEMGLSMGGGRLGYMPHVPRLREGEQEPYVVRPVGEAELPFVAQVCRQGTRRSLVVCVRDEPLWHYELLGRGKSSVNRSELRIIQSEEGEPVGFLAHPPHLWGSGLSATMYELKPGQSWLAVTPSVIRYLQATGDAYAERENVEQLQEFGFWLGTEHPVYQVTQRGLPVTRAPYAFHVRVPDPPDFLRHIAPVLEQRLAGSVLVGHTGQLRISSYRDGLRLAFECGRLAEAEAWAPTHDAPGDAAFPDLTFLQLLFGYRSLQELDNAFADCWVGTDGTAALLEALFPKQASHVWAEV